MQTGAFTFVGWSFAVALSGCSGPSVEQLTPPALVASVSYQFCLSIYAIDGEGQGYVSAGCENHGDDALRETHHVDDATVAALRTQFDDVVGTGVATCMGSEPPRQYAFDAPGVGERICVDNETQNRPTPAENLFDAMAAAVSE